MRLAVKETETENLFATLANKSPVGICIMQDGKFCYTNPTFQSNTGYREDELLGRDSLELVVPEDRERVRENAIKMLKGEIASPYQFRVTHKNGSIKWATESVVSVQYRGRRATLGVFVDITERKRTEEALRQSEEKYRALFDSAVIGTIVIDAETMKVMMANQAAAKMLGFSSGEELIGVNPLDSVPPEDRESVRELLLKEFFEQDLRRTHELRMITKDGREIWISANGARIMHEGRLAGLASFTDITERKQAEGTLQAEKNKLQSLIDAMEYTLTIQDTEYNIIYQNELSKIASGGDHLGEKCYRAYEGRETVCDGCPMEQAFKDGKSHTAERMTTIGGKVTFWENTANPIRDAESKIVSCLELTRDITERKKQEQALADELTRRRILIEQSRDGIVILDQNGKVYEANQRFAEMLGYTPEEAAELHMWDWDTQWSREQLLKMVRSVDAAGDHFETYHRRKDGSTIDVEISTNGAMFAGQKLVFCVCRDITERKRAEKAIKHAAEEWRETFDSISDAISIHDRDFRIQRANKAFADIFNMKPSQIIGGHCYELHKGQKPISGCPHQQTLATGKPAAAEFYESHLGKYLHESTSPIFNEKGEVVGTVHITRDITEQKQQNERLMMADRLASIGELSSGAAHELNNPLTSIIGFSQLLMEKDIADDIREDVKLIYNEAQRAVNVTKNFLTFARKHTPVKEPNQINNIIEDVLELHAHEHKVNNIHVEKHLAPNLPEIMVDYFQMQQVFMNIIINAEYFMIEAHNMGTLTITTKKENSTVKISFADDGPGIPPENLGRIFDPFFTTKEAGRGTGLGLSICHGIVTEHGGQIYVRSQLGKGATIFIDIPIKSLTHFKSIL